MAPVFILYFLVIAISIVTGLLVYYLPSFVAFSKNHPNRTAIFVLNLFLGWTLIGWVAALVWALTKKE